MKFMIITENMQLIQSLIFLKNRFIDLMFTQRPSESVEVNLCEGFCTLNFLVRKLATFMKIPRYFHVLENHINFWLKHKFVRFTTVLTVVSGGLFLDQKNFECRGLGAQRRRFLIRYDVEKSKITSCSHHKF